MTGTWFFPSNAHGQRQGFNDAGIDTFHGDPIGSLVRESIQNSLDAKTGAGPVRVALTKAHLGQDFSYLASDLKPRIQQGLKKATAGNHPKASRFYNHALELLESGKPIPVLGIHDFGTTGLTGTTDDNLDESSAWLALVKGTGDTVKQIQGAGGSYGHGSSAPLALSQLRSVLYLTETTHEGALERRFQGTSRLESLPLDPGDPSRGWTQGQGHFGDGEKCGPLFAEEIPAWVTQQRDNALPVEIDDSRGTSIFVLAPDSGSTGKRFWEAVALAVLANYYYTIAMGWLEVYIGPDYRITSETISTYLGAFDFEDGDDTDIATPETVDRLESSRTIASSDHSVHNITIDGFGSVELLLRLDESIPRSRVGVARSNGMLITREPWMLGSDKFKGLKPFDLFVYVKDPEGSEILRQLEPPAHDAFEIKRIDDKQEQDRVKKLYTRFKQAIWDFVRDAAKYEVLDEIVPEELSKYFMGNWSGDIAGDSDPTNYSLVYSPFRRVKAKQGVAVWGNPEDVVGVAPRIGREERGGTRKNQKHNFDDPLGEGEKPNRKTRRQVQDFRVARDPANPNLATIYFNAVDKSHRNLVIMKSGADLIADPIKFRPEKSEKWVTSLDLVSVKKGERKKLRLLFEPGTLVYSLEARLES